MALATLKCSMALSAVALALSASLSHAQVTNAAIGAFAAIPPQITFTGLSGELNGVTLAGVQFSYSLGNGQISAGSGPGNTNNMTDPDLVSIGTAGVLTLTLPSLSNLLGFGYAVNFFGSLANSANVTAFNGATNLGSLSYDGVPDPAFAGGFAGIQSVTAFNRVELRFNPQAAAFAIDNIRFNSVVPEPSTLVLVGLGLGAVALRSRRRSANVPG